MITTRTYKFSKLFSFEAKLIHIPSSYNRGGIDPLPRFFIKPIALKEVMDYSDNPSSVNAGYKKDKESGLYVKNIKIVDEVELQAQFDWISISPPYWFSNESVYSSFIEQTFSSGYSEMLEAKFSFLAPKVHVDSDTDEDIRAEHYYAKLNDFVTWTFYKNKFKTYPQNSSANTYDLESAVSDQIDNL